MPHLTGSTTPAVRMHGVTFTSFAASRSGAAQVAAWRADFAPGTPGQAHTMTAEEVLYVLDGELDVEVDGETFTARPGEAVLVPAGALFRASNHADAPARAWVTSLIGMTAAMHAGGEEIAPPWAQ